MCQSTLSYLIQPFLSSFLKRHIDRKDSKQRFCNIYALLKRICQLEIIFPFRVIYTSSVAEISKYFPRFRFNSVAVKTSIIPPFRAISISKSHNFVNINRAKFHVKSYHCRIWLSFSRINIDRQATNFHF